MSEFVDIGNVKGKVSKEGEIRMPLLAENISFRKSFKVSNYFNYFN